MLNRAAPGAGPGLALTKVEIALLDRLVPDQAQAPPRTKTLSSYLIKVARLGGYLARTRDPPPGNTVIWRGLSRLTDIALGAKLAIPEPRCGELKGCEQHQGAGSLPERAVMVDCPCQNAPFPPTSEGAGAPLPPAPG